MDNFFFKLSIMLVPGLFAVTCHEVSHGFVANRLGDDTARSMGRLTLNPLKHIDVIGTIMVFLVGIGWAKPVPVNFNNLRHPKRDMIWVAVAGPVTNFILATLSALLLRGLLAYIGDGGGEANFVYQPVLLMLSFSIYINLILGLFNLIPIPPLDGGRVAVGLLPLRPAMWLSRVEPFGMILIILVVFFTDLFTIVVVPALEACIRLLAGPDVGLVMQVTNLLMR